jgi:hypothetical protein
MVIYFRIVTSRWYAMATAISRSWCAIYISIRYGRVGETTSTDSTAHRALYTIAISRGRSTHNSDCPNGVVKIIAAIEDPPVIVKILSHLGLSTCAPARRVDPVQTLEENSSYFRSGLHPLKKSIVGSTIIPKYLSLFILSPWQL